MKVKDLLATIEEHVTDELSFCITITEMDATRLQVSLPNQEAEEIFLILEKSDSMYECIFQMLWQYFKGNVSLIKVRSVMDGEYLYMMIHGKVCILIQYQFENGKRWIYQLCHNN